MSPTGEKRKQLKNNDEPTRIYFVVASNDLLSAVDKVKSKLNRLLIETKRPKSLVFRVPTVLHTIFYNSADSTVLYTETRLYSTRYIAGISSYFF